MNHPDRERLLEELIRERWAPLLPPPRRRKSHARQAAEPEPEPNRRDTGTGWPS